MTDGEIRAPLCPGCNKPPKYRLEGQFWCGNGDCNVVVWDPYSEPQLFKAKATPIDLTFLADGNRNCS